MDYYPNFDADEYGTDPSRAGYRADISILRDHALVAGIPFWNYFSISTVFGEPDPTEAQLRWQMFTSLAFGSKGLLYFCYWNPSSGGGSIMSPVGNSTDAKSFRPTQHYHQAKTINTKILAWESVLMAGPSSGVWLVESDTTTVFGRTTASTPPVQVTTDGVELGYLIGAYTLADNTTTALMIVNQDDRFSGWPTITFDSGTEAWMEVSPVTGEYMTILDENPSSEQLELAIGAGDARLFIESSKEEVM
jgi:hypothetical protein